MSRYYCLLGNTPELSATELEAVVGVDQLERVSQTVTALELPDDDQAQALLDVLGGTVKVVKHLLDVTGQDSTKLEETLAEQLRDLAQRPTFGIGEWQRDHLPVIDPARVKSLLHKDDISARYIDSKRQGLSAAVLSHHKNVIELMVIALDGVTVLGQTVATQDIDDWTLRDREKPYANRRKGMLPPKVARMMVNLAIGQGQWPAVPPTTAPTIYDPFCGTGTVLLEAAQRGCRVVGSDIDPEAISGTKRNIEWWQTAYHQAVDHYAVVGDVTHVEVPAAFKPTAIVTEPFLGKQTPRPADLPNMFRGLEKMYLGAFKHWRGIVEPGAKVVIIFPIVSLEKRTFSLERLIDKLPDLGYTMTSGFIEYHRPHAVVGRQIAVLTRTT